MRVAVCPDKFRGSVSAAQAAAALAAGITARDPGCDVLQRPVADGGDGTVDVLVQAGWTRHEARVPGADGVGVDAAFATKGRRAVVELAQASGHPAGGAAPRPLSASTCGTGRLLGHVLDLGCTDITLTLGGSATTDGGAGLLQVLGVRLLTASGEPVRPGGAGLLQLDRIEPAGLDPRLAAVTLQVATDVDNPLLGPTGAAAVFAPQKGASAADVAVLDQALIRFAALVTALVGTEHADDPGAGAAGGTAFAAVAMLGATRRRGVDVVLHEIGVEAALAGCDLVVVGEGSLDAQSLRGKAPLGVAALARRADVPVVAVAGRVALDAGDLAAAGIVRTFSLVDRAGDAASAVRDAQRLLVGVGGEIAELLSREHIR